MLVRKDNIRHFQMYTSLGTNTFYVTLSLPNSTCGVTSSSYWMAWYKADTLLLVIWLFETSIQDGCNHIDRGALPEKVSNYLAYIINFFCCTQNRY